MGYIVYLFYKKNILLFILILRSWKANHSILWNANHLIRSHYLLKWSRCCNQLWETDSGCTDYFELYTHVLKHLECSTTRSSVSSKTHCSTSVNVHTKPKLIYYSKLCNLGSHLIPLNLEYWDKTVYETYLIE